MIWVLLIIALWAVMTLVAFSDVIVAAYRRHKSRKGNHR